jgi:hypothetical protein
VKGCAVFNQNLIDAAHRLQVHHSIDASHEHDCFIVAREYLRLVDANKTYYQLAQSRYEKGVDSYLTLLDAQRSLFTAEQGLVSTRLALLSNRVSLFKAIGGGWQQK